jgi:glutaredoxin
MVGRSLHALVAVALLALAPACEGELGLATGASSGSGAPTGGAPTGGGGPPVLMSSPDAGYAVVDAAWAPPDAWAAPGCTPSCAGRQCGADGCGGVCGTCGAGTTCNASFQCQPDAPPAGGSTHAVTLYGTASCGYCRQARAFFGANDVEFTDRDLNAPGVVDEAFERVHALTGEYRVATPTAIIDDHVIFGWNESEYRRRLGL